MINLCSKAPRKISLCGVNLMMRKVREQCRTTRACWWSQGSWDYQSPRWPLITHYMVMEWNHLVPTKSPSSRRHIYKPIWSLQISTWMIQRSVRRKCCSQMRLTLSFLASTRLTMFRGRKKADLDHNNTIPTIKHCGGNIMLWSSSSPKRTGWLDQFEGKIDRAKYREIFSENLLASASTLKMDGCSSMTMTQSIQLCQQKKKKLAQEEAH